MFKLCCIDHYVYQRKATHFPYPGSFICWYAIDLNMFYKSTINDAIIVYDNVNLEAILASKCRKKGVVIVFTCVANRLYLLNIVNKQLLPSMKSQ